MERQLRILLISLGGARYPHAPKLRHASFARSNMAITETMTGKGLDIVAINDHLDLFDKDDSWPDQLMAIRNWLRIRVDGEDRNVRLLVHYVGHGFFRPKSEQYFLSINRTDGIDRVETSATLAGLSSVIKKHAPGLRTYYLIDACFAASAIHDLQADGMEDAIRTKVSTALTSEDAETAGGIAALCSSSPIEASSAAGIAGLTQFTDGLVTILNAGDAETPTALSLQRLATLLRRTLDDRYGEEAIPPVFHAPQGKAGGIGGLALFPNLHAINVGAAFEEIADVHKKELRSKVDKFVDELSAAKEEAERERKIYAIHALGSRELRESIRVGAHFKNYAFDVTNEVSQVVAELSGVCQSTKGFRARLFPQFEFGRIKTRNPLSFIELAAKLLAKIKDELLRQNAAAEIDLENAQISRSQILQILFMATEMKKKLLDKPTSNESAGADVAWLPRALEALQERLRDMKDGLDLIDKKQLEMKSGRDENIKSYKKVDRVANQLVEVRQDIQPYLTGPFPVGKLHQIDRLNQIGDLLERALKVFNEAASFSRSNMLNC